jgi:hypothetical protein
MKAHLLFIACATATVRAAAVESPDPIPVAYPPERYEVLIAKSPFALATPIAAPPPPPDKSFADGWYVSGLARLDGKDFVTIKARDLSAQFQLFGEDPTNGVSLKKVDWSSSIGRSTVTIEKDGQTAKLEFNQAELQSPAGGAPPAPPQMGGQGGMRPPIPTSGNVNVVRPSIPRPSQPVMQPQLPAQGGLQPNSGLIRPGGNPVVTTPGGNPVVTRPGVNAVPTPDTHRRIRVINNAAPQ